MRRGWARLLQKRAARASARVILDRTILHVSDTSARMCISFLTNRVPPRHFNVSYRIVSPALRTWGTTRSSRTSRTAAGSVRSIQKFFTHRSVSTFDRVGPFQLTGALFLYGMALRDASKGLHASAPARVAALSRAQADSDSPEGGRLEAVVTTTTTTNRRRERQTIYDGKVQPERYTI